MIRPICILCVDDDPDYLDITSNFLNLVDDFRVITASSGPEAIRLMSTDSFDIIVSDYQMPQMNGVELLKHIRNMGHLTPFILTTNGKGQERVVIDALNTGADYYLEKGCDARIYFTELTAHIRLTVSKYRAERDLIDSEKRIADILNFLPDPTFAINSQGIVITWNQAMEEMTGVQAKDILGKSEYEYAFQVYHKRRPALIDLLFASDKDIHIYYPKWHRKGTTLYAESFSPFLNNNRGAVLWLTAKPLYSAEGIYAGAIETIRDITGLKKGEQRLRQNKERLRMAQEISRTGCWEFHVQTRVMWGSAEALRIFGFSSISREITLEEIESCIPDREKVHRAMIDLIHDGSDYDLEYLIHPADDSPPRYVHTVARIERDAEARPILVRGIIHDISDRKSIESELIRKNEELLAANVQISAAGDELRKQYNSLIRTKENLRQTKDLLENLIRIANVPIIIWDPSLQIMRLNHAFEILIGRSEEEMIGKGLIRLFPPDKTEQYMELIKTMYQRAREEGIEVEILHPDGSVRTIFWYAATLYERDGLTPVATIAQGDDVTYERQLEKEKDAALIQIKQNLAQLAILNDGIRNPLTVINICAERIPEDKTKEQIFSQISNIDEMVRQLDVRWLESVKILGYLQKHHHLSFNSDEKQYAG